uniref:Phosphatidate phosphatase APP1 catalytic domain-containing protein n=1 Tax=Hyaloperonospora arabidopsidis (strain Emoy2) TaxID=559515 RepID=M4C4Y7_HYAAE
MAFFAYAPLLCASWIGIMYVIVLYLSTESKWRWHDAQEFENRFWTGTAFLFSAAVLYIRDSPLAVGQWNSTLGLVLVFGFTMSVHYFDRFLHRQEISRRPRLKKATRHLSHNLFKYKATAKEKTHLLVECVSRIDRQYLPSTINNMLNLAEVKRREHKIFRILAGAGKDELNYVVNHIPLALLFYKVKDHSRVREDQNRTLMLDLLCTTRLGDLSVMSRALLLDALMVMKISAHPMAEKWVRNIILKTQGDDLSNLKTYTDAKGDFHSMHKLVFNDIRDPTIRTDIISHIQREASVQIAHTRLGTKRGRSRKLQAWRKVLSDVDDTLYSSGGRYPAGLDTRFPRHTLYPGVLAFYRELDMGTVGPDDWTDDRVGNLVFISARPHVYKDVSEKKSYAKFAALHEKMGMHTLPTLLAGNLKSGRAFMWQGDLEPMAQKKFENFSEFYQLYPEFKHVFVGDNGQGDVRAAELIVEKFGSDALEAAFFQRVQPMEKMYNYHSKEDLDRWRAMNIFFFDTYVGAAVEAFRTKKIRLSGLQKICDDAGRSFEGIRTWITPQSRERARLMLNRDLEVANALLCKKYEPSRLVMKPQIFALNSLVRTPIGRGIVRKFRGIDGIYRVHLTEWSLSPTRHERIQAYFTEESLTAAVSTYTSPPASCSLRYVKFYPAPPARIYASHTLVKTLFGIGRVMSYRAEDKIYTVSIPGDQNMLHLTAFLNGDSLQAVDDAFLKSYATSDLASPRMFAGVRFGIGFITKKLITFVPGSSGVKPLFSVAVVVDSPFGRGAVVNFRGEDRIYEIRLFRDEKKTRSGDVASRTNVFVQERCLQPSPVSPSRGFFSMLGLGSGKSTVAPVSEPAPIGSLVTTIYGKGVICSYRAADRVYAVALTDPTLADGHDVMAYLRRDFFNPVAVTLEVSPDTSKEASTERKVDSPPGSGGIFQLLRYGFTASSTGTAGVSVPYADEAGVECQIDTIFGLATTAMSRPHNGLYKAFLINPDYNGVVAYVQANHAKEVAVTPKRARRNTLELLASPFSYLLSSNTYDRRDTTDMKTLFPKGTLVVTSFGEGIVRLHRRLDDIYVVDLPSMYGFFRASSLRRLVRGVVGQPVDTIYGSGMLEQVREEDGVHVVALRLGLTTSETRAYLHPSSVLRAIKASRGDMVMTPFGSGVVMQYRSHDRFYCVALDWDSNGQSHVSAYIGEDSLLRTGLVEKPPSGCVIM